MSKRQRDGALLTLLVFAVMIGFMVAVAAVR